MKKKFYFLTLFFFLTHKGHSFEFKSTPEQVKVIELYSSEGCSSTPPADKWLSSLRSSKNLWKTFVPLKFQVDYWNYLGWTDSLSKKEFSKRQRVYQDVGNISSVYTPGVLLDGKELRSWRFNYVPKKSEKRVGVLSVSSDDNENLEITFKPEENPHNLIVHVALLGNNISHKISSGENSGKTLTHDFVVLEKITYPLKEEKNIFKATGTIPRPLKNESARKSIALWVTSGENPTPLQATGGDI
ncbi:MAG: DUF1223 domain-containing protein [Bdellovibrionota bacterium]